MVLRVEKSLPALREAIAAKLLTTCNRWRAQEEEPPITRAAFLRALQLASISIDVKTTSLIFECDDLFEDHGVELRLTPKGRITDVALA